MSTMMLEIMSICWEIKSTILKSKLRKHSWLLEMILRRDFTPWTEYGNFLKSYISVVVNTEILVSL